MPRPLSLPAIAAMLILAACSTSAPTPPSSLSGPSAAAPAGWQPKVGTCHSVLVTHLSAEAYGEVDCAVPHSFETVAAGEFQGDWPTSDTEAWNKAWTDCDSKVSDYLGGPWRERLLRVSVAAPAKKLWDGGARWYACELTTMEATMVSPTPIKGSLKTRYATLHTEMEGCVLAEMGRGKRSSIGCDKPHSLEFVASLPVDASYDMAMLTGAAGCMHAAAKFLGVPKLTKWNFDVVVPRESVWVTGDHNVACFIDLDLRQISHSVRGTGREP